MSEEERTKFELQQDVAPKSDAYEAGRDALFQALPPVEPVPIPGSFGQKLREIREGLGRTREELADDSGVGVATISELELGITKRPHRKTVRKLADALGLADDARENFEAQRGAPPSSRNRPAPDAVEQVASGLAVAQGMATRALPHRTNSFTGREQQLAGLVRALSEDVSRDDVPFAVRVGLGVLVRGSCAGLGPRPAAFALAGVILGG